MLNINGNTPNLKNSKSIGQAEIQNVKQNINTTSSQENMANSAPSLNSSTSVGSQELQNAKDKIQKSGNSKGLF